MATRTYTFKIPPGSSPEIRRYEIGLALRFLFCDLPCGAEILLLPAALHKDSRYRIEIHLYHDPSNNSDQSAEIAIRQEGDGIVEYSIDYQGGSSKKVSDYLAEEADKWMDKLIKPEIHGPQP